MALPAGVDLVPVSIGPDTDILGNAVTYSDVQIRADRTLVWAATKTTIYSERGIAMTEVGGGTSYTCSVMPVDTAGVLDANANSVTLWEYIASGRVTVGTETKTWSKHFQCTAADVATGIDLNVVPDDAEILPNVTVTNTYAAAESAAAAAASAAAVEDAINDGIIATGTIDGGTP